MVRILIVNDDRDIRDLMRDVLEDEGHTTTQAVDGREGLEQLRTSPASMVVLVDFLMPRMSGPDMMRDIGEDAELAARHAYILTGWYSWTQEKSHPMAAEDALKLMRFPSAHALRVLPLPFTVEQLLEVVHEAAQHLATS
jgi:CheY-like chemotaxis protein